jgi:hypothetical protein
MEAQTVMARASCRKYVRFVADLFGLLSDQLLELSQQPQNRLLKAGDY